MSTKTKDEYGVLICPNCQHNGMSKYKFWSSRLINEYTKYWIFYNKFKKRRGWKCWSIFELCKKKIHKWYDPGNCCFNPCSGNTQICAGLLKILLFIFYLVLFILGIFFYFFGLIFFIVFAIRKNFMKF